MPDIITQESDFIYTRDLDLPANDIAYFNLFRGGARNVERNLVENGCAAFLSGTEQPTYGDGYARFRSQYAFLQLGNGDAVAKTIITASRCVDSATGTTRPMLVSAYSASTLAGGGMSIFPLDASKVQFAAMCNNGGASSFQTRQEENIDPNSWAIRVLRIFPPSAGNQGRMHVMNATTGGNSEYLDLPYPRALTASALRIGSGYSSSYQGYSDHVAAMVADYAMSDSKVADFVAFIKKFARIDGITNI
ncbi:hypothetical protein [Sphingobium sp. WCS2017Hpa-17]|uniref:hypothetical protein n=1 Tax=Sphingobium sp. WCS2017Hpa-17 TaxID=3073638 RepID=UPI00288B6FA1|nr:hypothetical protein [Sphingobium sp. WCS2017Hpa-17]